MLPSRRDVTVEMLPSRCSGARGWAVRVKALGDHFSHWVTAVVDGDTGVRLGDGLDLLAQASW